MSLSRFDKLGAPARSSQRRTAKPRILSVPRFAPGDRVRWNRYEGVVKEVCADNTVLVVEDAILGRKATWRLDIAALSPVVRR